MTGQRGASETSQRGALATGLRTLELLVASHSPLGVTEIAEQLELDKANAHRTPLVGKTLRENRLTDLGVSVVGIWDRGTYSPATPDTVVGEHAILVLAGSAEQLAT